MQYRWQDLLIFIVAFLCAGQLRADPIQLQVLTSIKPLQLIVAAVINDNAEKVDVLLDPRMSPHDYQLRPSDRSKLERADVVFWIGPSLETFLVPVLSALPERTKVVSLQLATGAAGDPHLWMDPLAAVAMGHRIADALGELAPARSEVLHANAARLERALMAEDQRLREQISAIKSPRGYIVVHDAYGRFEARYGLQHLAALTNISDLPPSAQHIARIQELLNAGEISCVLEEPVMPPKVLQTLLAGRRLRVEPIDSMALGVPLAEGSLIDFYRKLGASVRECLQP